MVECPVCGKWLKHGFALNGHMRLKGDELHHAYFEAHNKQIPKKDITDIENQLQRLISLVKEKSELLEAQHNDLLLLLTKIIKLLVQPNSYSTTPIVKQEMTTEIPETKREKTPTFSELIKQYGNFENVLKYVNYHVITYAINNDPNLDFTKRFKLKDMAFRKWMDG